MNERQLARRRRTIARVRRRPAWFNFLMYLLMGRLGPGLAFLIGGVLLTPVYFLLANGSVSRMWPPWIWMNLAVIVFGLVFRLVLARKSGDAAWRNYRSCHLADVLEERLNDDLSGKSPTSEHPRRGDRARSRSRSRR